MIGFWLSMFEQAASYVKETPLQLVEGEGVSLLHKYIETIPTDQTICIYHTHVANQMPIESRELLLSIIESVGKMRDVFHIYNNIRDKYLHLDYSINGIEKQYIIAETDGHARWFKWLIKDDLTPVK